MKKVEEDLKIFLQKLVNKSNRINAKAIQKKFTHIKTNFNQNVNLILLE